MSEFIPEGFERKPETGMPNPIDGGLDLPVEHFGELLPDIDIANLARRLQPPAPQISDEEFVGQLYSKLETEEISAISDMVCRQIGYEPHPKNELIDSKKSLSRWVTTIKDKKRTFEDYEARAREKSGKECAAEIGYGTFMGRKALIFKTDFRHMGGSFGSKEAEKYLLSRQIAIRENIPVINLLFGTGGMQQQGIFALPQMQRMLYGSESFREHTNLIQITVMLSPVTGGVSASIVTGSDVIIGCTRTIFAFAGGRVIANATGITPPEGSQSAETHYLYRNVYGIVEPHEIVPAIGRILQVSNISKDRSTRGHKLQSAESQIAWDKKHPITKPHSITFGKQGFAPLLYEDQTIGSDKQNIELPYLADFDPDAIDGKSLAENYNRIVSEIRPDAHYLIQTVFDDSVPLYNTIRRDDRLIFPSIIGAIATLNSQPFMVIGDQKKSYRLVGGRVISQPSTPSPEDYEYVLDLREAAERLEMPIIKFTDTIGAEASVRAEHAKQAKRIAQCMASFRKHPLPVISVITGGHASGGAIATTPHAPIMLMTDYGQYWVAAPPYAAAIIYGTKTPNQSQIEETITNLECSAAQLKENGYPLHIVKTSKYPVEIARNIRHAIIETYDQQVDHSPQQLKKLRENVIYRMGRPC